MKKGEKEAKMILEHKGIAFDETYHDDNSRSSMPDFKYLGEERFLEVTHTYHNDAITRQLSRFDQKDSTEQIEIMEKAAAAYDRVCHADFPYTGGVQSQFCSDQQLLKKHLGYDSTKVKFTEQFSEFKCDSPIIECSAENIIREVNNKGKVHNSGNTDLFVFVLKEEFDAMMCILRSGSQNGCYAAFFSSILKSPFQIVYVCVWDWKAQIYETEHPVIMKFEKTANGNVTARRI